MCGARMGHVMEKVRDASGGEDGGWREDGGGGMRICGRGLYPPPPLPKWSQIVPKGQTPPHPFTPAPPRHT